MNFQMIEDGIPVKFYPYTHGVADRIMSLSAFTADKEERYRNVDIYNTAENILIDKFKAAGIKCNHDNKIVFELLYAGVHFFVGFYDWQFSIGLSIYGDSIK